ncbi:MAG TPA: HD domain-containing phosphohydrolase [Acidimicrobiales bacterium]|nr:HD domain-containing phosphohydrolase [Acidimicrobiales bacterium]
MSADPEPPADAEPGAPADAQPELPAPGAPAPGAQADAQPAVAPEVVSNRWERRSLAGFGVAAAVYLTPILAGFFAALILAAALPSPRTILGRLVWWVVLLAGPTAVFYVADRFVKRWLPLAALLRMTLVFPDRAPDRMAVARKAGNTRDLARRLEEAKAHGVHDDPTEAAERILALASALNVHDRATRGHSERVRVLTDMMADELKLSPEDREHLRWSALLHDIGKLGVHPDILNKPSGLSDEEFEQIRSHPLEGALIARPLAAWLGPWANTIAEHHERYDGSGYPKALRGEEISLGGRIVAVADSYEVITAVRSYKKAASPKEGREELARCAGTHFDPDVVRAFLQISIGKLRRAGGVLSFFGTAFGQRGGNLARRAVSTGHSVAAGVVAVAALSVASVQHGAFGGPITQVGGQGGPNLILDGSFDKPDVCPNGYTTFSNPGPMGSWRVGLTSVDLICGLWVSASGHQSVDMSGSPGPGMLSQAVSTAVGQHYTLSWDEAANPSCGQAVKTLDVFWNGRLVDVSTFDDTGHSYQSMGWVQHSVTVTASGPDTVVAFSDATPDRSDCGAALDDVSLVPSGA